MQFAVVGHCEHWIYLYRSCFAAKKWNADVSCTCYSTFKLDANSSFKYWKWFIACVISTFSLSLCKSLEYHEFQMQRSVQRYNGKGKFKMRGNSKIQCVWGCPNSIIKSYRNCNTEVVLLTNSCVSQYNRLMTAISLYHCIKTSIFRTIDFNLHQSLYSDITVFGECTWQRATFLKVNKTMERIYRHFISI